MRAWRRWFEDEGAGGSRVGDGIKDGVGEESGGGD